MTLFDTHAHLNFKDFEKDLEEVIKKCHNENVWINNVGSDYKTSVKAVAIAEKHNNVFATIGLHPIHTSDDGSTIPPQGKFDFEKYLELGKNTKAIAIGETGLDYYHIENQKSKIKNQNDILKIKNIKEIQKRIFLKHLEIAQKLNKPLVIHCRDAHNDLIEILNSKFYIPRSRTYGSLRGRLNSPPGAIHCFSGNIKQAQKYLEMEFYLGFTGVITYSQSYDKVIKETPLEKILIETDCPYLAPVPFRGQKNEPLYVKYVAQRIAEIKNLDFERVAEQTFKNGCNLFRI